MKAKTYDVVTNGAEFRLVDSEGNFYEEEDWWYLGKTMRIASYPTKEIAEQVAKSISWTYC